MLKEIFEKQKAFQELIGVQTIYITDDVKYHDAITHLVRAQDELNEAIRALPVSFGGLNKSSGLTKANTQSIAVELVDAFLFMVNVMNIMGIQPDQFLEVCKVKQMMNESRLITKERFKSYREYPIIIIDGPDGVGKSEICRKLSHKLQIDLVSMKRPEYMADIEVASKTFNETIDQIKAPLIQDRGFPSSLVYSEYYGRFAKTNGSHLDYLKELFQDRDVFVFIIVANEPYRQDDYIDYHDFKPLKELYIQKANQNGWKIIHNNESLDACVEQIIKELQS